MTKEQQANFSRWTIFVLIAIAATAPLLMEDSLQGSSRLSEGDILDWKLFANELRQGGERAAPSPARRIWTLLPQTLKTKLSGTPDDDLRADLVKELNLLLERRDFHDGASWRDVPLDDEAKKLLARDIAKLDRDTLRRLNRRLLESAFPRTIAKIHLLPIYSSDVVKGLYDALDALPPRSPVLFSFDFDPGSEAELTPMARAMLRQCFRKELRVVAITLFSPQSPPMMNDIVQSVAKDPEFVNRVVEGRDYVVSIYSPGAGATIMNMAQDFYMSFPIDFKKGPMRNQEVMKGINTLKDFPVVVTLSAGNLPDTWIAIGQDRYRFKLGLGCTAVMATDYYPRLAAGQLVGLVGGLSGAYQYESLVNTPAHATKRMTPQSLIHLLIILLVLAGNVMYFLSRRKK